jgi:TonB-dependent receptor
MDGQAIGGTVDFRTPTAFDFADPATAHFEVMTRVDTRALAYREPAWGGLITADLSRRTGPFGIYAAAYFSRRSFASQIIDGVYPAAINGAYAFDQTSGPPSLGSLVLTGVNVGVSEGDTSLFGGNLSFDWMPESGAHFYVRAAHARSEIDQGTSYVQMYGEEVRQSSSSAPFSIGSIRPRYYYETNPESAAVTSLQVGAELKWSAFRISPRLFVSDARNDAPDDIEVSGRVNQASRGFPFGQSRLFDYNGGIPFARLTPLQQVATSNIAGYDARRSGQLTVEKSQQTKVGAEVGGEYSINRGAMRTIFVGAKLTRSDRKHTNRDYTTLFLPRTGAAGPTLGSIGILRSGVPSLAQGVYDFPVALVDQTRLFDVFHAAISREFGSLAAASDQCGSILENSDNCDTQEGAETTIATYVGSQWLLGGFEVNLGLRYEETRIWNKFWVMSQADGGDLPGSFARNHSGYDKALPNLQVIYRPTVGSVYRLHLWRSYVLPSAFQLGGGAQVSTSGGGADQGGTTTITQGNPELDAIDSYNFDASAMWRGSAGELQVAAFRKSLRNYIFSTVRGYTGAVSQVSGRTIVISPQNGGSADIRGVEISAETPLRHLLPKLAGFSVSTNITLVKSRVDTGLQGLDSDERLLNQPDVIFNGQLSYGAGPYSAALSYRRTSDYISQYATLGASSNYNTWVRSNSQLDLVLGWRLREGMEVSLLGTNVLGNYAYRAGIGRRSEIVPSIVDAGRTISVRLNARY